MVHSWQCLLSTLISSRIKETSLSQGPASTSSTWKPWRQLPNLALELLKGWILRWQARLKGSILMQVCTIHQTNQPRTPLLTTVSDLSNARCSMTRFIRRSQPQATTLSRMVLSVSAASWWARNLRVCQTWSSQVQVPTSLTIHQARRKTLASRWVSSWSPSLTNSRYQVRVSILTEPRPWRLQHQAMDSGQANGLTSAITSTNRLLGQATTSFPVLYLMCKTFRSQVALRRKNSSEQLATHQCASNMGNWKAINCDNNKEEY